MRDFAAFQRTRVFDQFWLVKAFEPVWSTAPFQLVVLWPGELPTVEDGRVSEYMVSETAIELRTRAEPARYLLKTTGKAKFGWALKTDQMVRTPKLSHPFIPSAAQMRELGLAANSLPWLDAAAVADELATFNALRQVEDWAERNQPTMKTAVRRPTAS